MEKILFKKKSGENLESPLKYADVMQQLLGICYLLILMPWWTADWFDLGM